MGAPLTISRDYYTSIDPLELLVHLVDAVILATLQNTVQKMLRRECKMLRRECLDGIGSGEGCYYCG